MKKIAEFTKGEIVPEWLFKVVGAEQSALTFETDFEVYEDETKRHMYPKSRDYEFLMYER